MDMLRKPVVAAAKAGGYVLDGFPRTVEQAKASFPTAHALGVEVQAAVHLDVARKELVRRLLSRRRAQTIPKPSSRTACTCTGEDRATAGVLRRPGMDVHRGRGPAARRRPRGNRRAPPEAHGVRRVVLTGHPARTGTRACLARPLSGKSPWRHLVSRESLSGGALVPHRPGNYGRPSWLINRQTVPRRVGDIAACASALS